MTIKISITFILLSAVTSYLFSSCGKAIFGCHQNFPFTVDAKVYPDKDTINIGDTLFIEANIPTTLIYAPNDTVNFSGATGVSSDLGFEKLVSDSPIVLEDAVSDFDFKLIYGKELASARPNLIKIYSFNESGGRFLFKLAIVPKDRGTFRFGLGSAPEVKKKNLNCPTFTFNYLLKNTTDQHYYLYPGGAGVTPAGADYYFYVR